MCKLISSLFVSIIALAIVNNLGAQTPIVRNQYSADPSSRVFGNNVYLYPSHDILATEGKGRVGWFCMEDYHVFSSSSNGIYYLTFPHVILSNKLAWVRTGLKTEEPTFEPGVWKGLKHDAVQRISYDGIVECFEQGNELLGGYIPQMVSVHDPDEYIGAASSYQHGEKLYEDILDAYDALYDLKRLGKVQAIGVKIF